jgi:hypothetical protein
MQERGRVLLMTYEEDIQRTIQRITKDLAHLKMIMALEEYGKKSTASTPEDLQKKPLKR